MAIHLVLTLLLTSSNLPGQQLKNKFVYIVYIRRHPYLVLLLAGFFKMRVTTQNSELLPRFFTLTSLRQGYGWQAYFSKKCGPASRSLSEGWRYIFCDTFPCQALYIQAWQPALNWCYISCGVRTFLLFSSPTVRPAKNKRPYTCLTRL